MIVSLKAPKPLFGFLHERRAVIEALQQRYFESVPYVSTGLFRKPVASRSNIIDVLMTGMSR